MGNKTNNPTKSASRPIKIGLTSGDSAEAKYDIGGEKDNQVE